MTFASVIASPVFKGIVSGVLAAAVVDFHAFNGFKSFTDFTEYDWKIAAFRWFQGAVAGAVSGYGLNL